MATAWTSLPAHPGASAELLRYQATLRGTELSVVFTTKRGKPSLAHSISVRPPRGHLSLGRTGARGKRGEREGHLTTGTVGCWRRNIRSTLSFHAIDTGPGERRSTAFSYLGRALHCSDGKVMPSRVWQNTCLCCTAR